MPGGIPGGGPGGIAEDGAGGGTPVGVLLLGASGSDVLGFFASSSPSDSSSDAGSNRDLRFFCE